MILTKKILEKGKSRNGSWSIKQINCFGTTWHRNRNWKKKIIGKDFPIQAIERFLELKDKHLPAVRLNNPPQKQNVKKNGQKRFDKKLKVLKPISLFEETDLPFNSVGIGKELPELSKQERWAYSVEEVSRMTTLSKAFLRNEIRAENLNVRRIGRRVLILPEDLHKYLRRNNEKEIA